MLDSTGKAERYNGISQGIDFTYFREKGRNNAFCQSADMTGEQEQSVTFIESSCHDKILSRGKM